MHASGFSLNPGFLVVHANQAELLRELIVEWLKRYPLAVFETETLLVQSNGIAQWLKLALASDQTGLGIAAGLSLQMPGRFVWQLYRTVLPDEAIPEQSPLDKTPLQWRLFRLLPSLAKQAVYAPLRRYLADDELGQKRSEIAARLADLFDQYQVYRADWLAAWARGEDVFIDARGQRSPLPESSAWQAQLWRDLLADVGPSYREFSRADLHQRMLDAARSYTVERRPAGLPRRLIIFGISSLPLQTLEALAAISPYTQILLAVHNPCQHYWADIIADQDLLKATHKRQQQKPAQLYSVQGKNPGHPLLAAWGKQGRDYIRLLDEFDNTAAHRQLFMGQRIDLFESLPTDHILGQLQQDILELRTLAETKAHWPALHHEQCRSIQFATAHSVMREVEVLHNDLLGQFAADPSLHYRDIMVMVPDIHLYSAAIHAVFGRFDKHDSRYIPFTIADQGQVAEQPVLRVLRFLLSIRTARLGISELLDVLDVAAVSARYQLSESSLALCKDWLQQAGARLGLHQAHQQQQGFGALAGQHSMWFALRRMLLGYALGEAMVWGHDVGYAKVRGLEAEAAGKLADCLVNLDAIWQHSATLKTAKAWQDYLLALLEQWFLDDSPAGSELLHQLRVELTKWADLVQAAAVDEPLALDVVASGWLDAFDSASLQQRFLAGAVNFATLMPMRAIPFRQVHLLGMNDGAFPRQVQKQDFDLMAQFYRPGDRSRRDDDRYLLLEALLSARDRLRISWLGRDKFDNSPLEPSVFIAQLREHLAQGWRLASGADLLQTLTTEHPLQPFSASYLQQLDSYHYEWQSFFTPKTASSDWPLPERLPDSALTLANVVDFVKDPSRAFFRQRLQVSFELREQSIADHEDFDLDALQQWQARQQAVDYLWLCAEQGQAADIAGLLARWQQAGQLPPGPQGVVLQHELLPQLHWQWQQLQRLRPKGSSQRLALTASHGALQLRDQLSHVWPLPDGGWQQLLLLPDTLLRKKEFRWRPLLQPWLQLVLAGCQHQLHQTIIAADGIWQWRSPAPAQAQALAATYLRHWQLGMTQPLPLELQLAQQWLTAKARDDEQRTKLAKQFYGDGFTQGVLQRNAYIARVFADFETFWQQGFSDYAEQLYQPLLDHMSYASWQEFAE